MPFEKTEQPSTPPPEKEKTEARESKIKTPEELGIDIRYAAPEYFEEGGPLYEWAKNEARENYKEEMRQFIKEEILKGRGVEEIYEKPKFPREKDKEKRSFLAAKTMFHRYFEGGQPVDELFEEIIQEFKVEKTEEVKTEVVEQEPKGKIEEKPLLYDYEAERIYYEKQEELSKQKIETIRKGDEDLYQKLVQESIDLTTKRTEELEKEITQIEQQKLEEEKRIEEFKKEQEEKQSREERLWKISEELFRDREKLLKKFPQYEVGKVIQAPYDPDDPKNQIINWKITEISKDRRKFVLERENGEAGYWIVSGDKIVDLETKPWKQQLEDLSKLKEIKEKIKKEIKEK